MITEKDVTLLRDDSGTYCSEASALGLAPGIWPTRLETDLGNGIPFVIERWIGSDIILYRQPDTHIELHILND